MPTKTTNLPELERVNIKLDHSLFYAAAAFFSVCSIALMPVFLYILYFKMILLGLGLKVLITAGLLCAALVVVVGAVLYWFLFRSYHWQLDENGITTRSLLRVRHIKWKDVQDAWVEPTLLGSQRVVLQTSTNTRVVIVGNWRSVFPVVLASIKQHLTRLGISDKIGSVCSADTLWYEIPADLPETLSWCRKRGWGDAISGIVIAAMFWFAFVYMLLSQGLLASLILFPLLAMTTAAFAQTRIGLATAKRFSIDLQGFEAETPRGRVGAAWDDVTAAYWDNTGNERRVRICTPQQQVFLPWLTEDQDSGKMILATIRCLREQARQALLIPQNLCSYHGAWTDDLHEPEQETMPRKSEIPFIFGALGAVAVLLLLASQLRPQPMGPSDAIRFAPPLLAIIITCRLVDKSYSFRVDETGITRRVLGTTKQVRWEEVASVEVSQSSGNYSTRTLKDSTGKTLIGLSIPSGIAADSNIRWLLHTKLADVLPEVDQPKPWQARPRKVDD